MLVLPTWNKEGQWSLEYKCLVGDEEKGAAQSRLCHCVTSEQTVQRKEGGYTRKILINKTSLLDVHPFWAKAKIVFQ
jgi:hypothetical protein